MESSASAGRVASAVLVLLVYAVVEAPGAGWGDVRTILPLAGSALLVAAFTLIESRHPAPLVPPSRPAPRWPGSAWRWRSCSPADRGSQRTSCQSRTRRPMLLPQETW
jgi:hypothetical protein